MQILYISSVYLLKNQTCLCFISQTHCSQSHCIYPNQFFGIKCIIVDVHFFSLYVYIITLLFAHLFSTHTIRILEDKVEEKGFSQGPKCDMIILTNLLSQTIIQ